MQITERMILAGAREMARAKVLLGSGNDEARNSVTAETVFRAMIAAALAEKLAASKDAPVSSTRWSESEPEADHDGVEDMPHDGRTVQQAATSLVMSKETS